MVFGVNVDIIGAIVQYIFVWFCWGLTDWSNDGKFAQSVSGFVAVKNWSTKNKFEFRIVRIFISFPIFLLSSPTLSPSHCFSLIVQRALEFVLIMSATPIEYSFHHK